MIEREFVIAAFGDRSKQVQRLVENIRSYSDLPINILTTEDSDIARLPKELDAWKCFIKLVERIWPNDNPRADIRNSNYHKVKFALDNRDKSLCMLDDDMYIINPKFADGFAIAERFGCALPINPRIFNHYNMMGADVRHEDWEELRNKVPSFIPAVNFSPFFVYPHNGHLTENFLLDLELQLRTQACRGTVAIIKAMWSSQFTPVILPEQWCVCGSNAQHIKDYTKVLKGQTINIKPVMLHLGHEEVRKVFGVN